MNYTHLLRAAAARLLVGFGVLLAGTAALAQGGPPMVTDDPDTPGDGRWELNLGNIGTHTAGPGGGWVIALFDADINYGWGERLQLKLDTPWTAAQGPGGGSDWALGSGTTLAGFKWRFFDDEGGWSISTYPQYSFTLQSGSVARGVATPGHALLLPIEASHHYGLVDVDFEAGRQFNTVGPNGWIAGAVIAHSFAPDTETMLETHLRSSGGTPVTLLNLGGRWKLAEGLTLIGSAGKEFGPAASDRADRLYYLGVQVQR